MFAGFVPVSDSHTCSVKMQFCGNRQAKVKGLYINLCLYLFVVVEIKGIYVKMVKLCLKSFENGFDKHTQCARTLVAIYTKLVLN